MKNTKMKEADNQENSVPVNEEDKSEEFLNFERGMKHALGLSKKQVQEVIQKSPPDEEPKEEEAHK
jgi:hypothetical protein